MIALHNAIKKTLSDVITPRGCRNVRLIPCVIFPVRSVLIDGLAFRFASASAQRSRQMQRSVKNVAISDRGFSSLQKSSMGAKGIANALSFRSAMGLSFGQRLEYFAPFTVCAAGNT